MTDCTRAVDWLVDHLAGELAPDQRAWMQAHLTTCSECGAAFAAYRGILDAYGTIAQEDVDPSLAALILDDARRAPRRVLPVLMAGLAAVAASALLVVGGLRLLSPADPDDAAALALQGDLCSEAQDFEGAIELYREALRLSPADEDALSIRHRLGDALFEAQRFEEALLVYELVVERGSDYGHRADLLLRKGATEEALGKLTAAMGTYRRYAVEFPEDQELARRRLAALSRDDLPPEVLQELSALGYATQ